MTKDKQRRAVSSMKPVKQSGKIRCKFKKNLCCTTNVS